MKSNEIELPHYNIYMRGHKARIAGGIPIAVSQAINPSLFTNRWRHVTNPRCLTWPPDLNYS